MTLENKDMIMSLIWKENIKMCKRDFLILILEYFIFHVIVIV